MERELSDVMAEAVAARERALAGLTPAPGVMDGMTINKLINESFFNICFFWSFSVLKISGNVLLVGDGRAKKRQFFG